MMWAACCIMFFWIFKMQQIYHTWSTKVWSTSALVVWGCPSRLQKQPWDVDGTDKAVPFKQEVTLWLGKIDCAVYPVTGILPYLMARGSHPGPLFITTKGTYMTRQSFHILLSALFIKVSLPQKQFNTHSFRIGAATSVKAVYISDVHIQAIGQWQSNAYQLYTETLSTDMASFSKIIAQQVLQK